MSTFFKTLTLLLTGPALSWACPMCAGTAQEKDQYTVPLLIGFILLTYIPYLIIYRLIKKYG